MDFLSIYINALKEEYEYLCKHTTKLPLFDGKLLYEEAKGVVYTFNTGKELGLPDSTPVVVYYNQCRAFGEVLYIDGEEIVLRIKEKIDLNGKVEFSSSVHELVAKLMEQLKCIDYSSYLVSRIVYGYNQVNKFSDDIIKGQDAAISKAINEAITIIWGPPGTGKTYTLAEIAFDYYRRGKTVLIVSQSNIAVDNAMLEIKKRTTKLDEGKIFRAGYSKVKEIMSRVNEDDIYINARQYIEKTNPEIIQKLEFLLDTYSDISIATLQLLHHRQVYCIYQKA